MSASLVGSEMCIRDRRSSRGMVAAHTPQTPSRGTTSVRQRFGLGMSGLGGSHLGEERKELCEDGSES
eukprot:6605375-Alexandrium_andersonii.AAC.1